MMSDRLYTAKDVERCYPWISAGTTNYRVKSGAIPLAHPSSGTGIPNMFTLPELVHCAVIDELASLGVFAVQNSTTIHYLIPRLREDGRLEFIAPTGPGTDAYFVRYDFYEQFSYHIVIEMQVRHDFLPGSNVPREHREGPGRFYVVTYSPEITYVWKEKENKAVEIPFITQQLDDWLTRREAKRNRLHMAKAFIRVRQLYDLAAGTLGLPK
jgi:hypothetical protein